MTALDMQTMEWWFMTLFIVYFFVLPFFGRWR